MQNLTKNDILWVFVPDDVVNFPVKILKELYFFFALMIDTSPIHLICDMIKNGLLFKLPTGESWDFLHSLI